LRELWFDSDLLGWKSELAYFMHVVESAAHPSSEDTELIRTFGRKHLLAAAHRIGTPEPSTTQPLILQSPQGGRSSFIAALCPSPDLSPIR
jgi:hypothetical protein